MAQSSIEDQPQRSKRKPRSLVMLCLRTLARNIEEASIEALEHVPVALLWRAYHYYACSCSESIRGWRLFSSILLKELPRVPTLLYWFDYTEDAPSVHDLPRYVQLSSSSTVDFITHLAIHKVWTYRASDLMALAEMPNLGILELSDLFGHPQHAPETEGNGAITSVLNDRLVRGWSEKQKPFPNLRILLITSVHSAVTLLTLQYASRFPSLVYCGLRSVCLPDKRSKVTRTAEHYGWRTEQTLDPWRTASSPTVDDLREARHLSRNGKSRLIATRWDSRTICAQLAEFERNPHVGVFLSRNTAADQQGQNPDPKETKAAQPRTISPLRQVEEILWPCRKPLPPERSPLTMSAWGIYSARGEEIGNADLLAQGVRLSHQVSRVAPSVACESNAGDSVEVNSLARSLARQEVVPPKPMLNVTLGWPRSDYLNLEGTFYCPGDYNDSLEQRRFDNGHSSVRMRTYTFVRDFTPTMSASPSTQEPNATNVKASDDARSTKNAGPKNRPQKRKMNGEGSTFKPRQRLDLVDLFGDGMAKGAA